MKVRTFAAPFLAAALAASSAQALVDGSTQGVIAPTFYSTSSTATQSYIRLFGGAGTVGSNTTFVVTLEGVPSGAQYGSSFTLNIPYMASVQYSMSQLLGFAGNGSVPATDTGYAVYLRSTDPEAGYQHVTYNPVSALFENMSVCTSPITERLFPLHSAVVLTNVHTSKVAGGNYPSTIYLYNPGLQQTQYTLNVFNGGNAAASGTGVAANSGKFTCEYQTQVQANSIAVIPEATLEAATGCTIDSDQFYSNILVQANSLTPPVATHLVRASAYSGDINLSQICAVNKAPLQLNAIPFLTASTVGTTYQFSGAAAIQAFNIAGLSQTSAGGTVLDATPATSPTATVVTTSTGFTLTLPDGKIANLVTVPQAQGFGELARYEAVTTDGTRSVEVYMNARRAANLTFATYGYWVEGDAGDDERPMAIGTLAIGSATAQAALPTSANLVYAGRYSGFVGSAANTGTITNGAVSLTFNYTAKTVIGTVSSVVLGAVEGATTGPSNSLTLSGTITGNTFSGTVTPGAAPAGAMVDITGATGTFNGTINGPNGFEVVGNINMTLAGGPGVGAVFGARTN